MWDVQDLDSSIIHLHSETDVIDEIIDYGEDEDIILSALAIEHLDYAHGIIN